MNKTDWVLILLIAFLGISIGLTYLFFGPVFPPDGDFLSYEAIALSLISGHGFSYDGVKPTAGDAPAYPLFLVGIYKTFGHNYDAVRIIQILMLAGIGSFTYLICRRHLKLSSKWSALPSVLVVCWPYFILYSTLVLTEMLYAFFLILSVFFLLEFHQSFSKKSRIIAGFAMAVAALARPIALFLPFWTAFFSFLSEKKGEIFKKQLLLILVFCLVLSPCLIRNAIQFKTFVPIVDWLVPSIGAVFIEKYAGESYFVPLARDPMSSIKSRLRNLVFFWNPGAQGFRAQELGESYPQIQYGFLVYKILFFIISTFCLFSLRYIKRKEIFLIWGTLLYFWLASTIILAYPRYTMPVIPLILILAFFALNQLAASLPFVKKQVNS